MNGTYITSNIIKEIIVKTDSRYEISLTEQEFETLAGALYRERKNKLCNPTQCANAENLENDFYKIRHYTSL